jgi:hypothetical protein
MEPRAEVCVLVYSCLPCVALRLLYCMLYLSGRVRVETIITLASMYI